MESVSVERPTHKEWRRLAKKERRRRLRRKAACERDADAERLDAVLKRSAEYLTWLAEQKTQESLREEQEEIEHAEKEKIWLEEEVRAQKEWRIHQERKARARQEQVEQETRIRKEFEAKQEAFRLKKEEDKRKQEEELKKQNTLQNQIDDYIDKGTKTPEELRVVTNTQPGKELCPFFTKTGACRYGDTCSRNHQRVGLSRVILIPGFYSHFSLEKNSAEYDTDVALEFETSETRQHFREFYKDVVPELESFGRIKTLKYCCNTEVHLRGNLYVEYYAERDAARALRKLKGRWYAGRQLNCEFANIKSWRNAVCGMLKCPKGRACNFLHTFRNPHDEYDIKSPPRCRTKRESGNSQDRTSSSSRRNRSKWELDSVRSSHEDNRNWRWSESPEPEVDDVRHRRDQAKHSHDQGSERCHRSRGDVVNRHSAIDRGDGHQSSTINSRNSGTPVRCPAHRKSRRYEDKRRDEEDSDDNSSRTSEEKHKRRRSEQTGDANEPAASSSGQYEDEKKQLKNNQKISSKRRHLKYDLKMKDQRKTGHKHRKQKPKHHSEAIETCDATLVGFKTKVRDLDKLTKEKKRAEKRDSRIVKRTTRDVQPKSKWDDTESSGSYSQSDSNCQYSDSSSIGDKDTRTPSRRRRRSLSDSGDEWETTNSESDKKKKIQC